MMQSEQSYILHKPFNNMSAANDKFPYAGLIPILLEVGKGRLLDSVQLVPFGEGEGICVLYEINGTVNRVNFMALEHLRNAANTYLNDPKHPRYGALSEDVSIRANVEKALDLVEQGFEKLAHHASVARVVAAGNGVEPLGRQPV